MHKDFNFYGFLKFGDYEKEITVGMDKKNFPKKFENYAFKDGIDEYIKKTFKKSCNQVVEINCKGKKYLVAIVLNESEKKQLQILCT